MRCTSKKLIAFTSISVLLLSTGCSPKYKMPFSADTSVSSFRIDSYNASNDLAEAFASDLCVVDDTNVGTDKLELEQRIAAGLFDNGRKNTIYAKDVHQRMYPASLTKIMTAIVALKNGSPDMLLTASPSVEIEESGAQLIGLKPGDTMTLTQALNVLLIYSANDVAVLISEGIAGSEEDFVKLMNEEALRIGATNTHFTNPHGLTDDEHYTTPYDMYLMMNEAVKYDLFNEIIHTTEYSTVYNDVNGKDKELNIKSTNFFLQGDRKEELNSKIPGLTVIGGKTGTTNAAGHCLVLLSKDTGSNPYISIVMNSENRNDLYDNMVKLLELAD